MCERPEQDERAQRAVYRDEGIRSTRGKRATRNKHHGGTNGSITTAWTETMAVRTPENKTAAVPVGETRARCRLTQRCAHHIDAEMQNLAYRAASSRNTWQMPPPRASMAMTSPAAGPPESTTQPARRPLARPHPMLRDASKNTDAFAQHTHPPSRAPTPTASDSVTATYKLLAEEQAVGQELARANGA